VIGRIRNSAFIKVLCGLMGLYLLNISVDTADRDPRNIPEDLTINDQESIIEIIVEQIFGYENAIKEYDDNDTEDHNNKKNSKIDLINFSNTCSAAERLFVVRKSNKFPEYITFFTSAFIQLDFPPPKV